MSYFQSAMFTSEQWQTANQETLALLKNIGAGVLFAPNVVIMDCDRHVIDRRPPDVLENQNRVPVVIEDHAWIALRPSS